MKIEKDYVRAREILDDTQEIANNQDVRNELRDIIKRLYGQAKTNYDRGFSDGLEEGIGKF